MNKILLCLPIPVLVWIFWNSYRQRNSFRQYEFLLRPWIRAAAVLEEHVSRFMKKKGFPPEPDKGSYLHIRKVNVNGDWQNDYKIYRIEMAGLILSGLVVFAAGICLYFGSGMASGTEVITEFKRPAYGEDTEVYELIAEDPKGNASEITLYLDSGLYTQKEIQALFDRYYEELLVSVLGDNPSWDFVTKNLNFSESSDFGFIEVEFGCDDSNVIDYEGRINREELSFGEYEAAIILEMSYENYNASYNIPVKVVIEEEELSLAQRLTAYLNEEQAGARTNQIYTVPSEYEGTSYVYHIKKSGESMILVFVLILTVYTLLIIRRPNQLKEQYQKRKEQLIEEYPDLLSRMMILMRAGMPIKRVWMHMVDDYCRKAEKETRYAYEEMQRALLSMENGIGEAQAYQEFGKNCELSCYVKLGSMLEQNLRKGSREIVAFLENERLLAIEEKKRMISMKGNLMSTKLMLPMIALFGLVLVIIMVPAFTSFQM